MTTGTAPERRSMWLRFMMLVALSGLCTVSASRGTAAEAGQELPRARTDSAVDPVAVAAENGDAASQVRLGVRYYNGISREHPPDYEEALKWFHLAADQGNAEAQARIGMMYHSGKGVPRDEAEAARWYLLAANGDYPWAQLQLSNMYQQGVGVPRDQQEARRWLKLYSAHHPDKSASRAWELFAVAILAVIGFSLGLLALQRGALTGWQRRCVAVFVHLAGIALVLNTLATYGFGIVFPHCSHSFLATACMQISDPQTRKIVDEIGDWAIVNLIFRFMAGVGFVLDALAVWYLVYLCRLIFKRPRVRQNQGLLQTGPSVPARNS